MQAVGILKGHLCSPATLVFHHHAHISKLKTLPLHNIASISSLQFDKLKLQSSPGLLQVFSSTKEHTQQNDRGTKAVKVKFVLQRRCEFGQQFCVIGEEELLGAWAPKAALPMQWSEGHIWTAEQDLSVGMCMEFKVILMAEQEVIEWQPGPNQKVEFSGSPSYLVVSVPWSDEEGNLKEGPPQLEMAVNEHVRIQDDVGIASFAGKPPDLVKDIESESLSSKSPKVMEEQLSKERSINNGITIVNAEDVPKEQQTEAANEMVVGHLEVTDGSTSFISELISSECASPFAIPESWYGEDFDQTNAISSSHDLVKSSPVSLKEIANGKTVSSDLQYLNDNDKEGIEEKLVSLNKSDDVISEGRTSSMFEPILNDEDDEEQRVGDVLVEVISEERAASSMSEIPEGRANFMSESILRDEDDEEQRFNDVLVEAISEERAASSMSEFLEGRMNSLSEPIFEEENDGERRVRDMLVEVTSQTNVETSLSDIKVKDTDEKAIKKHKIQNGAGEMIAGSRSETVVSPIASNSPDENNKEAVIDSELAVPTFEVPKIEQPSMTTDSREKVETKPLMAPKEKRPGQTGWSKFWDALVHGRIN